MKTCRKCGYTGDRFDHNRHVCKTCRLTQRDMDKAYAYEQSKKRKQQRALNAARWREKNRDKHNALCSRARAKRANRCVPWADEQYIQDLYRNAKEASELFGIPFEVDHVLPLCGELISGLHVETNLQVLPRALNRAKWNKFEVV